MSHAVHMLIALFKDNNSQELCFLDYATIPNYEQAISELENLGSITLS